MKTRITNKNVRQWYYKYVIDTELWAHYHMLITKTKKLDAAHYVAGIYGWNYDVYEFPELPGVAVLTGYRGFPAGKNFIFNYSKFSKKYDVLKYNDRYDYSRYIRREYIKALKKLIEK